VKNFTIWHFHRDFGGSGWRGAEILPENCSFCPMQILKILLAVAVFSFLPLAGMGAEDHAHPAGAAAHDRGAGTGGAHVGPPVAPAAPTIFNIGPLEVTNAMIYTWIIAAIIFFVVRAGTRNLKEVPTGLQNAIEAIVESLEEVMKGLLEPKVVRWVFPVIATFFLFILISNLMGLLPVVGSIGYGTAKPGLPFSLEHVDTPLFRPPTADANTTLAMALIFFVMSTWWAIKYNGFVGLAKHVFGVKGGMTGFIVIPLTIIFLFVGVIEVISIAIRPIALAMRLYGNVYGGESVLTIMLEMLPLGIAAVPFYFLELVVAVVQALVFTLLCVAFIGTLCSHLEDEHAKEGHGHAH
jgi:F-type H+-transporting ATPase subunit a